MDHLLMDYFFLFPLAASLVQAAKEGRRNELQPGNEITVFSTYWEMKIYWTTVKLQAFLQIALSQNKKAKVMSSMKKRFLYIFSK